MTRGGQTLGDFLVHMETLRRCGFTELRPGQSVLVRYGRGPKKGVDGGGGAQAGRLARTVLPLTLRTLDRLARSAALYLFALGILAQASGFAAGTGTLVLKTYSGGDHSFNIEVATTDRERALGLHVPPLAAGVKNAGQNVDALGTDATPVAF